MKPVRAGDLITAHVDVVQVVEDYNRVRLTTACVNHGEIVLSGEAIRATGTASGMIRRHDDCSYAHSR
jgi:hypothetical protein